MSSLEDDFLRSHHVISPDEWAVHLHGGLWIPQCTVLTRKDAWCKNPIFYGQIYSWWGDQAVVSLEDWALVEAGMCSVHARRNGG